MQAKRLLAIEARLICRQIQHSQFSTHVYGTGLSTSSFGPCTIGLHLVSCSNLHAATPARLAPLLPRPALSAPISHLVQTALAAAMQPRTVSLGVQGAPHASKVSVAAPRWANPQLSLPLRP